MTTRAACLAVVLACSGAAPAAAQDLAGHGWAASSAGHLAIVPPNGPPMLRVVAPDGQISVPEPVAASGDAFVGAGARGDVIAAYIDSDQVLWVRYRPPGGPLGPPERIAGGASYFVESIPVALDAAGNAVIAYALESEVGGLHVRVRDASGAWLPDQALGGTNLFRPALALSDNGTAVLTWRQGSPKGLNATQIAVSTRPPGGVFSPAQVVAGIQHNAGEPVVAANDRGDAVVAWIERHYKRPRPRRGFDSRFSIAGVFRSGGGAFGRPAVLSHIDAALPAVSVLPSGRMLLSWVGNRRLEVRVRSATGRLGRAQIVTRDLQEATNQVVLPAGRGTVAWSDRDPDVSTIRVVQAGADGRFGAPQTVGRVRGEFYNGTAFAPLAGAVAVVAPAPLNNPEPVRWQRIPLTG